MAQTPVKIAVDAMGGDFAPSEVVRGAVNYIRKHGEADDAHVLLVGVQERVLPELDSALAAQQETPSEAMRARLQVVHAPQVIEMDEHPMEAYREKLDSSIVVCADLVRRGEADGAFSAGNTGAVMVTSTQVLERIPGVKRPAIATIMPTETGGRTVVVDAGANVDCRPSQLLQFALLGSVYAEKALGMENPRVGLLANGEEETKGNELIRETHTLLENARPTLNFIGNVEGNHVFEGKVDVVVCDGFVGNVLLKGAEGTVRMVLSLLAADAKNAEGDEIRNALLASLLRLRQKVDYSEFGGAPLLGVNGVAFIAHGRSDYKAISSGIRLAVQAARSGYVNAVRDALLSLRAADV